MEIFWEIWKGGDLLSVAGAVCNFMVAGYAGHKKWHVHSDFCAELHEAGGGEIEVLGFVEVSEDGGGVGCCSAKSGLRWDVFLDGDAVGEFSIARLLVARRDF